jgi:hypothetical protein
MNAELRKAQRLIMEEEVNVAEGLQSYKNKRTGKLTREGILVAGFRNHTVNKMKEVLDVFLEDKEFVEITIPDSLFFCINEALEEHLNKNLIGKDLEKVEIIPGKDFNSYKLKFYYSD